jgi:hypothetical protein
MKAGVVSMQQACDRLAIFKKFLFYFSILVDGLLAGQPIPAWSLRSALDSHSDVAFPSCGFRAKHVSC